MSGRKYKVEFNYKDGSKEIYIGTGTPRMSLTEYFVNSPDGKEIVILKESVRSFVITPSVNRIVQDCVKKATNYEE